MRIIAVEPALIAVVTGEACLVRKYEHVLFSSLEIALLARRFAPRSPPPWWTKTNAPVSVNLLTHSNISYHQALGRYDPQRKIVFWRSLSASRSTMTCSSHVNPLLFCCNLPRLPVGCDGRSESRKGFGWEVRGGAKRRVEGC